MSSNADPPPEQRDQQSPGHSPAHRVDLRAIARRAMLERGFLVNFPESALQQITNEAEPQFDHTHVVDLSSWDWSSIDNDESRDLDQIEFAKRETGGIRIYIGIADVDWFVPLQSALDQAANHNTTSIYTGVQTFPMLPEKLSTDLSSLVEGEKRLSMVVEILVGGDGRVLESNIYPAIVRNHAQLTYQAVGKWLEQEAVSNQNSQKEPAHVARDHPSQMTAAALSKIEQSEDLKQQLRLQDEAAQALRCRRHEAGALTLQTSELQPIMSLDGSVLDLAARQPNRAARLIEDFMIAANQATAMFLDRQKLPSIRRVVEVPERWDRIVALAAQRGGRLPSEPDAHSLEDFLVQQQQTDPDHFLDLSLSIIKLLGRGEYKVKSPPDPSPGHFGLAVQSYSHSTAPNRRYADLLMQRLLKAAISKEPCPYSVEDLESLARRCTDKEDDANKVERFVKKCAAAMALRSRIGEKFNGLITGASEKGTWVRLKRPPVEGRLNGNVAGLEVGDRVRVRLASTDAERGFIDFELLKRNA